MAAINPIRYRGYYYDAEMGMYYLQSRYFDPALKRFINADGFVSTGQMFTGYNMFLYCHNNAVRFSDENGDLPDDKLLENAKKYSAGGNFITCGYKNNKKSTKTMFGVTSSSVVTANLPVAQALPRWSPINMTFGNKESYTVSSYSSGPSYFSTYATFDVNDPYVSSSSGLSFSLWNWELKLSTGWENLGISLSYTNENTTYSMALKANLSELNVSAENAVTVKWDDSSHTTYANISVSGYLILGAYCFAATGQLPSTSSPGVIYGS